jgi:hypothetical protein
MVPVLDSRDQCRSSFAKYIGADESLHSNVPASDPRHELAIIPAAIHSLKRCCRSHQRLPRTDIVVSLSRQQATASTTSPFGITV